MPRYHDLKTNFVAGELDPLLLGRSDIKHYFNGAERIRNGIVLPEGAVRRRPGGRYIATLPLTSGGSISNVRLCDFQFNTEQTYLMVFTDLSLQIYRDETLVATVVLPYTSADLVASYTSQGDLITSGIYWTQSKDTLIIFHENHPTKRLQRQGSDANWVLTDLDYQNIPRFDFGLTYTGDNAGTDERQEIEFPNPGSQGNWTPGDTFSLILEDEETDNIQFTTNAASMALRMQNALRALPNTSADGIDVTVGATTAVVSGQFDVTFKNSNPQTLDDLANNARLDLAFTENGQGDTIPKPGVNATAITTVGDEATFTITNTSFGSTTIANQSQILNDQARVIADVFEVTFVALNYSGNDQTVDATFVVDFTDEDGQRPWGQLYTRNISTEQIPTIDVIIKRKGENPGEPVWSVTRGYPRCGVFFQGRLWVASSKDLPHWVWSSRVGSENDFNSKLFSDDYGIAIQADTDDVPAFTACHVGRHLQFFSSSGEYYIPVSEREAVTPANVALRRTSSRGNKAGLRVYDVDGATHFVQRRGRALREFLFTDVEQAYQANNISLLSPHLMRDPVDFALRRSTSTTDADYEFFPNIDGTQTVFCTLRTQEVNAMTLWKTKGDYKAVAVVLDDVYFAVKRTIDGVEHLMLEKQDDDLTVDCAVVGGAGASLTASHLPNTEVDILLDGVIQEAATTDGAGLMNFNRSAATKSVVGLRYAVPDDDFPDLTWVVKTLPIELGLPEGAQVGKRRRIVNLSLRLSETEALQVNNNVVSFQQFGSNLLDKKVTPFTGVKTIRGLLGWDFEGAVVLGGKQSLPATVLALNFGVSV